MGDRVRAVTAHDGNRSIVGKEGTVRAVVNELARVEFDLIIDNGHTCAGLSNNLHGWNIPVEKLTLIEPTMSDKATMTVKEKFLLGLTKEPQKSFRKAGITNGDDMLTPEGQGIFLTWLLNEKYADEFKTAVVDGLLEE